MATPTDLVEVIGRYALHAPIAKGGMAVVHLARILGPEGFSRVVAAKRLLPQYVEDEDFIAMFLDEAKIASKIHHPNVVPVIDIVYSDREVILVQEYVHGVPLDQIAKITARGAPIPEGVVLAIISGILSGLHAAHEAKDERGEPLNVVHRDVSPHNVMVTVDGVARVLDFGIAKARSSSHVTREGVFKGKLSYLAPEQLGGSNITRRADVYGAAVVLWEMLANRRLFASEKMDAARIMAAVVGGSIPSLRESLDAQWSCLPPERQRLIVAIEPVVARALSPDAEARFASAHDMLAAITAVSRAATPQEVAAWIRVVGASFLESKQQAIVESEEASRHLRMERGRGPESASRVFVSRPPPSFGPSRAPIAISIPPLSGGRTGDGRRRAMILGAAALLGILAFCLVAFVRPSTPENAASQAGAGVVSVPSPLDLGADLQRVIPQDLGVRAPSSPGVADAGDMANSGAVPPPRAPATATARPSPPPRPHPPERPRPAPEARAESTRGDGASTAASSPTPAASADCTTPYYWDGPKKVYKPNCL